MEGMLAEFIRIPVGGVELGAHCTPLTHRTYRRNVVHVDIYQHAVQETTAVEGDRTVVDFCFYGCYMRLAVGRW